MHLFRSIRVRLTLWYILLLALILAAFSAGIYFTLRHSLYANLNDSLEARSEELLASVQFEQNRPTLAGLVPQTNQDPDEQFTRVFDTSGTLTFNSNPGSAVPAEPKAIEATLGGRTVTRSVDTGDEMFRSRFVPVRRNGEIAGVLEVARSEGDATDTLRTLLLILGLSYPATLAIASLGGVFLAGRALSPIDRLTRVARRLSAEDLSRRLDLALPDDEVGRLARTFDEMLARLDLAFRQQRQFTADASHELRTPLTAIKGQTEVALSKGRSTEAYREVLRSVNDEVDRLIRLVGSLLTLARADAGQMPLALEPVNVSELVGDAVEQVRPFATERGVQLEVTSGPEITIRADQDLLLQLLLNLLDNAVKHTAPGGRATVKWGATDDNVALSVSDTGPGIAAKHRSRIFDRFYRADVARSRAEDGVGLGLSICKWIAEAHGGTISAQSASGEGAVFTATLPRNPDRS